MFIMFHFYFFPIGYTCQICCLVYLLYTFILASVKDILGSNHYILLKVQIIRLFGSPLVLYPIIAVSFGIQAWILIGMHINVLFMQSLFPSFSLEVLFMFLEPNKVIDQNFEVRLLIQLLMIYKNGSKKMVLVILEDEFMLKL
ncbi:hypothetical protein ACJX0J_039400 [Zea mays]